MLGERLRSAQDRLAEVELPRTGARRDAQTVSQLLAEREAKELLAARLAPPPYISKELGERPTDPRKAKEWDRAVQGVEELSAAITASPRATAPWGGRARERRRLGAQLGERAPAGVPAQAGPRTAAPAARPHDQQSRKMDHGLDLSIGP